MPKREKSVILPKSSGGKTQILSMTGDDSVSPATVPPCPEYLKGEARTQWQTVGAILAARGLLDESKLPAFGLYCVNMGRHIDAERKIAELGTVVKSPTGFPVTNPYLAVSVKAAATARQLAFDLGMLERRSIRIANENTKDEPGPTWHQRILGYLRRETELLQDDVFVQLHGVPWNASEVVGRPATNAESAAIARTLTELENAGFVRRYRPSGKTKNVLLLEKGMNARTA
jgi:P27 family predicted phage terminase small subunit